MSEEDNLHLLRVRLIKDAGVRTERSFSKLSTPITFLGSSLSVGAFAADYKVNRDSFAARHNITTTLLANHKVAALYIYTLIDADPSSIFLFPDGASNDVKRSVWVTFLSYIIYGVLMIRRKSVHQDLQGDLHYCLSMELPESIEWLCFAMHALCQYRGTPTNIRE